MGNFAVIENGIVTNILVCDSKTIAEQVTGKTCVEYTDANPAFINGEYKNGKFLPSKPYPSWTLDLNDVWQPPAPCPTEIAEFGWSWDEDALEWVDVES
jgi:hypothetical protein